MNKEPSRFDMTAAYGMLYVSTAVLTGTPLQAERLSRLDLKSLYAMSRFHALTALVCEGLDQIDYTPPDEHADWRNAFQIARQKSVRKNLLLDTERAKLLAFMEQTGIWYIPLKGVVLKDMYPKMGLRQMADNDILFDETYRQVVRDWFVENGYEIHAYGESNHDVYLKEPVYNFEMHCAFFRNQHNRLWRDYYADVHTRLVKDADNRCGYHFTDEDFYVYLITHGYKHYYQGGIGLRFLLDLYVYLERKQATMDFAYIDRQLDILALSDFEADCRALLQVICTDVQTFSMQALSEKQQHMLVFFLTSGSHGTAEHYLQAEIRRQGKCRYLLRRIFPGSAALMTYHPIFSHKWLMPVGWVYRAGKILTSRSGRATKEMRHILKVERDEFDPES